MAEGVAGVIGPRFQRKDIGILGVLVIILCLIQFAIGIVLIFFAIFLPNNKYIIFHILQWTFAFLATTFPWFGILGGYKALASALIVFSIYCVFQIAWNILYIIGLGIVHPVTWKLAPELVFASIEIILGIILFIVSSLMALMVVHYYHQRNSEM